MLALGGIVAAILGALPGAKVEAGIGDSLSGYAWSGNVGWISFNCTNTGTCGASNYGVTLSEGTNNLSGYAWNDNVGWISFNETAGCPAGTCRPRLDETSGELLGWARALSANGAESGGWDGWISLNCDNTGTCGTVDYGVALNAGTGEFSGYAWDASSDAAVAAGIGVGWISFSCANAGACGTSDYKVVTDSVEPATLSIEACLHESGVIDEGSCTSGLLGIGPTDTFAIRWNGGSWEGASADSCASGGRFSTGGAPSGTDLAPDYPVLLTEPTIVYTVSCEYDGVTAPDTDSVTVTIGLEDPTIAAEDDRVEEGGTTTLTWDTGGHMGCTIENSSGTLETITTETGSVESEPIFGEAVYSIACTDDGSSDSVTVRVFSRTEEI